MGASASIRPPSLAVTPGEQDEFEMTVRNTGSVVDEFRFEAVGPAAAWVRFEPASHSLFPGADEEVRILVQPPRTPEARAGTLPLGVKVTSREDPDGSVVEEVSLDVRPFVEISAELVPRTVRGRLGARSTLAVDNRGNAPLNAELTARDPDDALLIRISQRRVVGDPGTASFVKVRIRPKQRFLRGPDRTRSFQLLVEPDGHPASPVDGSMVQEAVIPRWGPRALAATAAALLALVLAWLLFMQPAVESAAKSAAEDHVDDAAEQAATNALRGPVRETAQQEAKDAVDEALKAGLGDPMDKRLRVDAPAGETRADTFDVAGDKVFSLTDIVLGNPQGILGVVLVKRNDEVLFEINLAHFRDLDYHLLAPVRYQGGDKVVLEVRCAAGNTENCQPGAYISGFVRNAEGT